MKLHYFLGAIAIIACSITSGAAQKSYNLNSPDGKIKVAVTADDVIRYDVEVNGKTIFNDCAMSLTVGDKVLGANAKVVKAKVMHHHREFKPVFPLKFSTVTDDYNELSLDFKGNYSVLMRAYNDGVAYRFVTRLPGKVEVMDEGLALDFPADYMMHLQPSFWGWRSAYEAPYWNDKSSKWKAEDWKSTLPILIEADGCKVLFSETDLRDYPHIFFNGTAPAKNGIKAVSPREPLGFKDSGDRSQDFTAEAAYMAKTDGTRSFPWRYMLITTDDRQIIESTLPVRLGAPCEIEDTSWIKSGQVSWDWYNGKMVWGDDVNFKSGINTDTYKYYIDFASKHGVDYIILDEGWSKSTREPFESIKEVDLPELVRYGKERGVGVVVWLTWLAVEKNMDKGLFAHYEKIGVKGMKIDFMDRSDIWMVNYYERVAKLAAKHHLIVDFHGSFKPSGLEARYPNVLAYEGVLGLEQLKGCTPNNSVYLPFIRNMAGPMDFTPGAMISAHPEHYGTNIPNAMSVGTRAYHMALFVLFETNFQMLADTPTQYYRNQECTDFITSVPVNWDETIALEAKVGEYAVVARRHGNKWFIGGMTNDHRREFTINLSFLTAGKHYRMTSFVDGINSDRQAMDYRRKVSKVTSADEVKIFMQRNGGFAAVLEMD